MICVNLRLDPFIYFLRAGSCNLLNNGMFVDVGDSISNDFSLLILFDVIVLNSSGLFKELKSVVVAGFRRECFSHISGYSLW